MHERLDKFLESKEIIANIKPNPRNGKQPDVYFDEELYKNRFKIEQANGWFDGKKFKHVYPLFYFFSKIKK